MTRDLDKHRHRKDLTFRQAEGIDPLPKILAYGELDSSIRRALFNALWSATQQEYSDWGYTSLGESVINIVLQEAFHLTVDDAIRIGSDYPLFIRKIKNTILEGTWENCLEVCQVAARASMGSGIFISLISEALDKRQSPYMLVDLEPWTIIPRGDENERTAFEENWAIIKASSLEGAKTHLRKSAEALNKGDSRDAIREAIHAVEGTARIITGNEKAKLGAALGLLEKDKGLHSALKAGFSSLYGYASDEKGIRHALIEGDNANVGQDEALFMFSACTAFVAYLARKYPEKV